MHFNVGFATDIGRKRAQNQDNGAAVPELGLFLVADGMGGHRGGETASAIAVETITKVVKEAAGSQVDEAVILKEAIQAANQAIHDRATEQPDLHGMGTTVTAMLFAEGVLYIGHVGDSRCYFMRPDALWQVTRDHSLVQEKLRAGLITREQVKTDRMKNVITRSVGFELNVEVEIYEFATQPGDVFLVCSDGLSGLIEDSTMLALVQKHLFTDKNADAAVKSLVAAANENGGDDNITTVMVQVG
jgi:protein phosphatase